MDKAGLEELKKGVSAMAFIALSRLTDKEARDNIVRDGNAMQSLIDTALANTDTGEQSDGYHTFNELYHQRAVLFAALCKAYPDKTWRSLKHNDGTMFDDETFICGIFTPHGGYTYHYNVREWQLFDGIPTLTIAPEWDGHTEKDVARLLTLANTDTASEDVDYEQVQRLISYYQGQIAYYPIWIKGIQEQHESNWYKKAQIEDQEKRKKDDEIILRALQAMKGERK